MISSVSIKNFKVLKSIEMHDISRISLISGKNNVGKSTILETIFLYMDHSANNSFSIINWFRGINGNSITALWESMFTDMDTAGLISIEIDDDGSTGRLEYSRDDNYLPVKVNGVAEDVVAQFRSAIKKSYSLRFQFKEGDYSEIGHFSLNHGSILREITTSHPGNEIRNMRSVTYINSEFGRRAENLVGAIGRLEFSGQKELILKALRLLDSEIDDIVTLAPDGISQLYVKSNNKLVPLNNAGDGMIRMLSICVSIMEQKNGIVLIDELETGIHYSVYQKLWDMIDYISLQSNCQVIATTHSYELLEAVQGSVKHNDDFSYYRIGNVSGQFKAFRFSYEMLDRAINSELEVR